MEAQGEDALPPLFKDSGKVPLFFNLASPIVNFENVKIYRNIHVSHDFRRAKFQNSLGAPDPPSWFALFYLPDNVLSLTDLTSRDPAKVLDCLKSYESSGLYF